jgi:hypothetical protein
LLSPSTSIYSLLYIGFDTVWKKKKEKKKKEKKKKEKKEKEVNMGKSAAAYSRNKK